MKEILEKGLQVLLKWVRKNIWYSFLLLISTLYVFYYRYELYQLKTLNARNLVFLIWIGLLLLPLFSEMELLGVKIKKAVESANKEIKDDIRGIEQQLQELTITNSMANHIQIGAPALPSEEKLEELMQLVRGLNKKEDNTGGMDEEEMPKEKDVYLFKVRLGIEKAIVPLYESVGSENDRRRFGLAYMIKRLVQHEILDGMTADLIMEVVGIANRGVHGEIISDEYINFVRQVYPRIQDRLKLLTETRLKSARA
ncbi:MAG: hypothetical protein K2O16_19060 [Lachnospiraceae bacterium]|nr:hypothetical protein [Lachnospiraceae bacterium]